MFVALLGHQLAGVAIGSADEPVSGAVVGSIGLAVNNFGNICL